MEADCSKTSSEVDTAGEEIVTDSLGDILSSSSETSDSSLTSLTSDNLLQQFTTEDETLKSEAAVERSEPETSESNNSSDMSQIPNLSTQDWYLNPMFQRYWRHYSFAMEWCRSHFSVTQKLQKNSHTYSRHSQPYSKSFLSKRNNNSKQNLKTSKQPTFKVPKTVSNGTRNYDAISVTEDSTTCDDNELSDADSEVYEMEITEEMVDFFAKSEKHRKERDENKTVGPDGKAESLVDIAKANNKKPTIAAPKERPGLRRTSEMTQLYGKGAAMIHGMETALQMTYDRNNDIKQPPCWPNMPLKIVFN